MTFIVVRNASTERRPHVGRASAACGRFGEWSQRSLRCVDACVTVAKHWKSWKSYYNMTLVTSFDALRTRPTHRKEVHSWSGKLHVGRTSAARRPQCVGRSASAAMRRRSVDAFSDDESADAPSTHCGRLCTHLNASAALLLSSAARHITSIL